MVYPLQFLAVCKLSMRVRDMEDGHVESPNRKRQRDEHEIDDQYVKWICRQFGAKRLVRPNVVVLQILRKRKFFNEEVAVQVEVVRFVFPFKYRAV